MDGSLQESTPPPAPEPQGGSRAFDRLFSRVYDDLRQLAHAHVRRERAGHTLNTTALVHEAYMKLGSQIEDPGQDRTRFFAFASRAMRQILVDYARQRGAEKRGGDRLQVTLQTDMAVVEDQATDLLALDEALSRLAKRDPRLEQVVECRFFGGMTAEETAEVIGVSLRTVERDWTRARAYLHYLLQPEPGGE